MMHAFKELNLTDKQKASIHDLMKAARPQFESLFGQIRENQRTLMTTMPNDPSYASTLATAKTLAGNMVQQRSDLRAKIYGVLTPEQKAKLPQIFADMKAKFEKRRAEFEQKRKQWEQQHPNGAGSGGKSGPPPASNS
jgi:Spy/CpxP family protein refolding chaperone